MSDPKNQIEAYKQFAAFHAVQETLFWTRNNIRVALQEALHAALATVIKDASAKGQATASLMAGAVGLFLAIQWITMVKRSRYLFEVGLVALERAEAVLSPDEMRFRFFEYYRLKASNGELSAEWLEIERKDHEIQFAEDKSKPRLSDTWIKIGKVFIVIWLGSIGFALRELL